MFLQIRSVAVRLHRPAELVSEEVAVASQVGELRETIVKNRIIRCIAAGMTLLALGWGASSVTPSDAPAPQADSSWGW
jgi:hypothetical protein